MKNVTDKHKILIFCAGIVTVIVVFYYYILIPQQDRIAQLTSTYESERQRVQTIEAFAKAHPDIGVYEQELNNKIATVDKMLPHNIELSEFIVEVEKSASNSGLQLTKFKPGQEVNKNGYREIPLELVVKGDYFQTLAFLKKLEDLTRFNSGNNVSVQYRDGQLESKILINIYSFGVNQQEQTKTNGKGANPK
ncbi:type 4a pilus biogenesis protein PilO [Dendrosporobacter sp. 1207_IL3150]|uniref:type 4a pilus biogenesis protein PilO n=1 Tax=Dendrosporobacter sp. 1207_IL3150 TaxID=3084054 RepID=UPI002FDB3046